MPRLRGLHHLTHTRRRFGLGATVQAIIYRIIRRSLRLQADYLISIDTSDYGSQQPTMTELEYRFVTPEEIRLFARDPELQLDPSMYERAKRGLDLCFATLRDGQLVNYNWYALHSVEAEHFVGLPVSFPSTTAYFYKSFTDPTLRGQGINRTAIQHALGKLAGMGIEKVFGVVEFDNWSSLRSCERTGFSRRGLIVFVRSRPARLLVRPKAAGELHLHLGADVDMQGRAT